MHISENMLMNQVIAYMFTESIQGEHILIFLRWQLRELLTSDSIIDAHLSLALGCQSCSLSTLSDFQGVPQKSVPR